MVISLIDHEVASGNINRQTTSNELTLGNAQDLYPLGKLSIPKEAKLQSISLKRVADHLTYQIKAELNSFAFDANSGVPFKVDERLAKQLAENNYRGDGSLTESEFRQIGFEEVPNITNVWQISFDDEYGTRVYLSSLDGKILAHRNKYWAVVDFLLMLHFMDYARIHSFNNPQIIIFGFLALWLTLSGLFLVKSQFFQGKILPGEG